MSGPTGSGPATPAGGAAGSPGAPGAPPAGATAAGRAPSPRARRARARGAAPPAARRPEPGSTAAAGASASSADRSTVRPGADPRIAPPAPPTAPPTAKNRRRRPRPSKASKKPKPQTAALESKAPTGRPTSLTPVIHRQLLDSIAAGLPVRAAAALVEVSPRTVEDWLDKGRADGAPAHFRDFAVQVDKARAQALAARIANVRLVAKGGQVVGRRTTTRHGKGGEVVQTIVEETFTTPQWAADAWWAERQVPEEFTRRLAVSEAPPIGTDWNSLVRGAQERGRDPRIIDARAERLEPDQLPASRRAG